MPRSELAAARRLLSDLPAPFQDTGNDGGGDLVGVGRGLDHLVALGIGAVWLWPIYPSPMADFGYGVAYRDDRSGRS